jgi:hypothetical protein
MPITAATHSVSRSRRRDTSLLFPTPFLLARPCYTPHDFQSVLEYRSRPALMMDSDLLDPYEKLIQIEILGRKVEVPENNRLLRCFQYLSMRTISYGDFCWNGDCTNCQIWYHREGQTERDDKPALSCRTNVLEGMVITRLSRFVQLEGINK